MRPQKHWDMSVNKLSFRHQLSLFSCQERRGESREQSYIDDNRLLFKVVFPLGEVVVDFFDELKSVTKGYAR